MDRVQELVARLLDETLPLHLRREAARELAAWDVRALTPLVATVDDELLALLKEALEATDASPELARRAADAAEDPRARVACARALRLLTLRATEREVLRGLVGDEAPAIAREAALTLAARPVASDLEVLQQAAARGSVDVRYFAAVALGGLARAGSSAARRLLGERLGVEADPLVSLELRRALTAARRED